VPALGAEVQRGRREKWALEPGAGVAASEGAGAGGTWGGRHRGGGVGVGARGMRGAGGGVGCEAREGRRKGLRLLGKGWRQWGEWRGRAVLGHPRWQNGAPPRCPPPQAPASRQLRRGLRRGLSLKIGTGTRIERCWWCGCVRLGYAQWRPRLKGAHQRRPARDGA